MSQENVDLVWEAGRAWNDGGVEAILGHLSADVELHPPDESMEPGVYRGHDGVRDYLGRLAEIFDQQSVEPLEVIEVDEETLVLVYRIVARSEKFGAEIDATWAWVLGVEAGKTKRIRVFSGREKALEAAGLSE